MNLRALCSTLRLHVVFPILLFLGSTQATIAQKTDYYPYFDHDTTRLHQLALDQKRSVENYFVVPKGVSADFRKSYTKIFKQNADVTYKRVRNSAMLDPVVDPFVQAVYQEVLLANKDLPVTRLILTRNPVENAYAQADGTIFFNIGLLAKLENEGQVAFVICHELAHVQLKHMERGIKEVLDVVHSKAYKKQYKQISREKYNKHSKMEMFFEGLSLNNLYHKRSFETQADSLGFVLFANTKYSINDAFSTLQTLDAIDKPYEAGLSDLNKFFGCAAFDPNQGSAAASASLFERASRKPEFAANPDTLKTHPDCMKRLQFLRELSANRKDVVKPAAYHAAQMQHIRDISRREVVQSWFDSNDYDYALYNALQLMETQPESQYLRQMVLASLAGMKKYMQQHRYAEAVSIAHRNSPESLNHILNFLNDLNTSDFKKVSACFSEKHPLAGCSPNEEYELVLAYASGILNDEPAAAKDAKSLYQKTYKTGRFNRTLFKD